MLRYSLPLLVLVPAVSLLSPAPAAQEKTLQREVEVQDAEIDSLIRDLGSNNFDEREIATQKLLDMGQRAVPFLEKAVKNSKETEVRWNAKRLLREIRETRRPMSKTPMPPRVPSWGGGPMERDDRMEQMFRQLERQQQEMRRLMEERFRIFERGHGPEWHGEGRGEEEEDGDEDAWFHGNDFRFDDLERSLREIEEEQRQGRGGSSNRSLSLRQGPDGVRIEIHETGDGKDERKVYEAQSVEEFRQKYPEIAERYGISGQSGGVFKLQFGQPHMLFRERMPRHEAPMPERAVEALPGDRLGVEVDGVESALASYLDIPEGVGLIVRRAEKGSLAERMGIKEKDILLSINGKDIRGRETVLATLSKLAPGSEVSVEIQRAGSGKMTVKGTKEKAAEGK